MNIKVLLFGVVVVWLCNVDIIDIGSGDFLFGNDFGY